MLPQFSPGEVLVFALSRLGSELRFLGRIGDAAFRGFGLNLRVPPAELRQDAVRHAGNLPALAMPFDTIAEVRKASGQPGMERSLVEGHVAVDLLEIPRFPP